MATGGVPEIPVTGQLEAQPAPVQPTPPAQAFQGVEIGKGLTEIGQSLFKVGVQARQYAGIALAQIRETQFQNIAEKIKKDYKNLHGAQAVAGHDDAAAAIEQARAKFADLLPTQQAKDRFMDGSFRSYRYALESLGDHWDRENFKVQFGGYKAKQAADVRSIYEHPEDTEQIRKDVQKRAKEQAGNFYDPETAEAEAGHWDELARTAAIRSVADHNGDIEGAIEKWGHGLPPAVINGAVGAAMRKTVTAETDKIFKDVPLVDSRGRPDKFNGTPDEREIYKRLRAYDGQFPQEVTEKVSKRLKGIQNITTEVGTSLGRRIQAIAQAGGGFDLGRVPPTMLSELNSIDSTLYGKLVEREVQLKHRGTRWNEHEAMEQDRRDLYTAKWNLMYSKPDSAKATYTKDQFERDLLGLPLVSDHVRAALSETYDRWAKEKPDGYEHTIRDIVTKEVHARWGSREARDHNVARVYEWAIEAYRNGAISKDFATMADQVKTYVKNGVPVERVRPPQEKPAPPKKATNVIKWGRDKDGNPVPLEGPK